MPAPLYAQDNELGKLNGALMLYRQRQYAPAFGMFAQLALAAQFYRQAAEQGSHAAQTNLAMAYEDGRGVSQDVVQARLRHERAIAQGSEVARQYLQRLAPPQ